MNYPGNGLREFYLASADISGTVRCATDVSNMQCDGLYRELGHDSANGSMAKALLIAT